ncbi:MAG: NAD-dependent DNA ligase LigA, partial [Candidatus Omnitrophica bacterium]|nr:NAD-dependent DNA ligase LigA [Candidatus Omnitrophota bacterium]
TTIQSIVVQVGRTGVLTPVAELAPVPCSGVTISRATLHNFDEVERLGVDVGDTVLIERAGDVIPKIIKVVQKKHSGQKSFSAPKKCPVCQTNIVKENVDGVMYRCPNVQCPKQLERGILHFASRGAMDIVGMGDAVVRQLMEEGLIKSLDDIYSLSKDQLLTLELFKEKKAANLFQSIQRSKGKPLSRLLFGFGIPNVGQKAAKILAARFKNLDQLMRAGQEDLVGIPEIGPVMGQSVVNFFKNSANQKMIEGLKSAGLNTAQDNLQEKQSMKFTGKKFVFTGELSAFTRSSARELVEVNGGEVIASVSKNTDFVVVGRSPGSKLQKAEALNLTILNETQFKELLQ